MLAGGTLGGGTASAESVVEVVEAALGYHPQVWRDQALSVAAEYAIDEAYSDFLPDLDLDASTGYEVTNSPTTRGAGRGTVDMMRSEAFIRLTQLIYDFQATANSVAAAESELEASNADLQATSERVARIAIRRHLDVLSARERVALAEENLADLNTVRDLISGRTEAGRAAEVDLDQASSRVALARADLARRRGELREAMARFVENVGYVPGPLELPETPDFPETRDVDAAITVAMEQSPVVHSTAALWDAREAEVEIERAAYFPRLDFEASSHVGENIDGIRGGDSDIQFLVRLTWNLFNGFGDVARVRRATYAANAASLTDAEARRAIRESVRVAFRALETAEARLPQLRADADASVRTFEAYRQQYDVGQRSLLDLLDARDEMFTAQEAAVFGTYDVLQARYELLFTMGVLLDHLGLVVFQDREQYRAGGSHEEGGAAAAGQKADPQNAAVTFADADWSGEVVVPGGLEFGNWLGGAAVPPKKQLRPGLAALSASVRPAEAREAAAKAVRREIEGIDVETVPAMTTLPERSVGVLPAGGLHEAEARSGAPAADAGAQKEPAEETVSAGGEQAVDAGSAVRGPLDLFGAVLEELASVPSPAEETAQHRGNRIVAR